MYAIISIGGGRQVKVEEGQQVEVDYRDGVQPGDSITFDQIVATGDDSGVKFGTPTVSGASVSAEVVGPTQGKKVYVQKFRRRKNSRRRTGHRQLYTAVKINTISAGGSRLHSRDRMLIRARARRPLCERLATHPR